MVRLFWGSLCVRTSFIVSRRMLPSSGCICPFSSFWHLNCFRWKSYGPFEFSSSSQLIFVALFGWVWGFGALPVPSSFVVLFQNPPTNPPPPNTIHLQLPICCRRKASSPSFPKPHPLSKSFREFKRQHPPRPLVLFYPHSALSLILGPYTHPLPFDATTLMVFSLHHPPIIQWKLHAQPYKRSNTLAQIEDSVPCPAPVHLHSFLGIWTLLHSGEMTRRNRLRRL